MKPSYYLSLPALLVAAAGSGTAQLPTLPPAPPPPGLPALPPPPATPRATYPVAPPKLPDAPPPDRVLPALPSEGKAVPPAPASAAVGRFVVLKDDRLVEGAVSIVGETVRVRRGAIDADYPRADVRFVGATRDDAYRFQRGLVGAGDAKARLGLARWCALNGMRPEALAEARAAAALAPGDPAAGQMVRSLEESLRRFPPAGAPAAPPAIPHSQSARPAPAAEPEPDVGPEAHVAFRTRVQPVLANLCMGCHGRPNAEAFKLARPDGYEAAPAVTRQNLRAALAAIRKGDPATSPLLTKALTAHGGMRGPSFVSRQAPAYRVLECWVAAVAGPQPAEAVPQNPPAAPLQGRAKPAAPPALPPVGPLPPGTGGLPTLPPAPPPPFGEDIRPKEPAGPSPTNGGEPVDDFDPSVFNRKVHPNTVGGKE